MYIQDKSVYQEFHKNSTKNLPYKFTVKQKTEQLQLLLSP